MYDSLMPEQSAKSHAAVDPLHMVILLILFVNFVATTVIEVQIDRIRFEWYSVLHVLVALALFLVAAKTRTNALKVQDRVIRLEMQLRLQGLLSEPLRSRINELTPSHMVGLRFASDAELPALVEQCLKGELAHGEAVKKQVKNWVPDYLRG